MANDETLKERAAKFLLERVLFDPKAPGFWVDFHDEVTTLLADFACIVALPIVKERIEAIAALKSAKQTIRTWHDMRTLHGIPIAKETIEQNWRIYEKNAPEMKAINAALAKANNQRELHT